MNPSTVQNDSPAESEANALPSVDKSGDRVQKMFSEIAPKYDRMNHLLSMNTDRYWRWKTVRKLRPDDSGPILDVCTGTGDLAIAFAKKTRGAIEVIGTDFCEEMLEFGRQKKQKLSRPEKVEFVQADTQQLPFESDRFQIVSVAFGLRNVADTEQGLREMVRVCAPNGKVAILEFSTPRRQPIKMGYQWYFKNVLPKVGQFFARNDSSAYEYLPASVGEFPAYEALAKRMESAGLKQVKFFPLTFGVATLYVGVK